MPSAVDYGLQLYFIVTKIVTSLLSGAVLDGSDEDLEGPICSRLRGRAVGRRLGFHATPLGPHHSPPSPARWPPFRGGQWSPYPSHQRASARRLAVRFLSPAPPRLFDDRSGSYQEPKGLSRPDTQRLSSQAGAVDNLGAARHGEAARGSPSPPSFRAAPLADHGGSPPDILRLCFRDCGWSCVVEAVARTLPKTTIVATAHRPGAGLLRGDCALGSSRRSPSHPSATKIAPGHRPLRLAHLPDELSQETDARPVGRSAESVRRRLRAAARLPTQSLDSTPKSSPPLSDSPDQPDGHRPPSLPFSTARSAPSAQTGQRWRSTKLRGLSTSTPS